MAVMLCVLLSRLGITTVCCNMLLKTIASFFCRSHTNSIPTRCDLCIASGVICIAFCIMLSMRHLDPMMQIAADSASRR